MGFGSRQSEPSGSVSHKSQSAGKWSVYYPIGIQKPNRHRQRHRSGSISGREGDHYHPCLFIEQEIDFGCECPESYENDLELYEFPFETCQLCGSGPLYFVEEFAPESVERSVCTNCWYEIIHTENDFEEYGDE